MFLNQITWMIMKSLIAILWLECAALAGALVIIPNDCNHEPSAIPTAYQAIETIGNGISSRRHFFLKSVTRVSASVFLPASVLAETEETHLECQPARFWPTCSASTITMASAGEDPELELKGPTSPTSKGKPYAPVTALLPATRCRLWLEDAYQIAARLNRSATDIQSPPNNRDYSPTLEELNDALQSRPNLFVNKGERPLPRVSSPALAQFTARTSPPSAMPTSDRGMGLLLSTSPPPSLATRASSALNRADVARQWGIQQAQESEREAQNEVRAAWNCYTRQLEFDGRGYEWTASRQERKDRIRNDQIPTPQAVIAADLDLRDLYRNQFLTALDDVTAEAAYQVRVLHGEGGRPGEVDVADTLELMNQAYNACNRWFAMIDDRDVQEAEEMVRRERK